MVVRKQVTVTAEVDSLAPWLAVAPRRGRDPMVAILDAARWDDEPLSEDEHRQVDVVETAIARGERMLTTAEVAAEIEAAGARA